MLDDEEVARGDDELSDAEVRALGDLGWFQRDGFLGAPAITALHAWTMRELPSLRPAGMSRGAGWRRDETTRGDAIGWVEHDPAQPAVAALWRAHDRLQESLNRGAFLGLRRREVQLARYAGAGERYARHRDEFTAPAGRRVTAILYLNPEWQPDHGGVLRLYAGPGAVPVDVEPILDRLVVFLADRVEHEVLPCHAPRLAITAWYYGA